MGVDFQIIALLLVPVVALFVLFGKTPRLPKKRPPLDHLAEMRKSRQRYVAMEREAMALWEERFGAGDKERMRWAEWVPYCQEVGHADYRCREVAPGAPLLLPYAIDFTHRPFRGSRQELEAVMLSINDPRRATMWPDAHELEDGHGYHVS